MTIINPQVTFGEGALRLYSHSSGLPDLVHDYVFSFTEHHMWYIYGKRCGIFLV